MTTKTRIPRTYSMNDASMLLFCKVIHDQLAKYQPQFEAFDGRYTPQFVSNYDIAISEALKMEADYQLKYAHAQSGMDVQDKINECRNAFQMIKYFVLNAFANSPGIRSEFGFEAYSKTNFNADSMIQFMTDLHQTALKYQTQLIAAGYTMTSIANILTLAGQLQNLNTLKGQTKGHRYSTTQQRIEAYNALWLTCSQICKAGKIIYNSDYGMYQLFLKPGRKTKKQVAAEED